MAIQRHDLRTPSPQKYGKPTVAYPYGDTRFPRIVEERTAKKGTDSALLLPFLTPHRDQARFPGAVLVEQTADKGDDTDKNITETYEVLPGPIFIELSTDQDTGIPVIISKQKRAGTDIIAGGELAAPSFSVVSVSTGSVANPCVVTLNVSGLVPQDHLLSPRMWVSFSGTGTSLDGEQLQIFSVPAQNQVMIAWEVNSGATGGTMACVNRIDREVKPTDSVAVNVKVDSFIAAVDVTAYNESVPCQKEYAFPDCLIGIRGFGDVGTGEGFGSVYSYQFSTGTSWGLSIQHGYRGPCPALRLRLFSMGPPTSGTVNAYAPTVITPTSGTVAAQTETQSFQVSGSGNSAQSTSFTWRTGGLPPMLTTGLNGPVFTLSAGGLVEAVIPPSTPTTFNEGDFLYLMEPPQKLRCGLWQLYVWKVTCPYTMGNGNIGILFYSAETATYSHTAGAITDNTPSWTGASAPTSYSVSPALPAGLSLNTSTGVISGAPSAITASALYTITASNGAGPAMCSLNITIT